MASKLLGPFIILGLAIQYFMSGEVVPIYYAYSGFLMVMVMGMLASAYPITKIVKGAMTNNAFYYAYRGGSILGDLIGLWELINVIILLTWSMLIWGEAWFLGFTLWQKYDRVVLDNGKLTVHEGFKFMLLGFIAAAGIWVAGINVGDMAASLLGFFNTYNVKLEASYTDDDGNFREDRYGFSLLIDMILHEVETFGVMTVVSGLVVYGLGFLFTFIY